MTLYHYIIISLIIKKWDGRNDVFMLSQAAGHGGGMSRLPGGGGREPPCVTCIRIELGETICPDGETSAWPGLCGALYYTTLALHYLVIQI